MSKDTANIGLSGGKRMTRTLDEKLVGNSSLPYLPVLDISTVGGRNPLLEFSFHGETGGLAFPDGNEAVPMGSGTVCGLIGQGGMARVYRIWNEKMEVYRAVKVYYLSGRAELKKRFETEIKISAKLSHPNIVQIHSTGEWNGYPYIEMELVEGVSLEKLIGQHGKIPFETVTGIGIQIADALCYAHNLEIVLYGKNYRGIIHRDLKPGNIMISESGTVKLLDFGIARPAEVGLHTVSGNIVGTLPYLSPEQIDNLEIDQRSDLYSLGTILYEALTGEKAFPQETITALMRMKSIGKYRGFESFSCNVPVQLSEIIKKCLDENKEKRFGSSMELKNALLGFLRSSQDQSPSMIVENYLCNREMAGERENVIRKMKFVSGSLIGIGLGIFLIFQFLTDKEPVVKKFNFISDSTVISVSGGVDSVRKKMNEAESVYRKREDNDNLKGAVKPAKNVSRTGLSTQNQIAHLKEKYRSDNLYQIGDSACKASRFNEAIIALKNIPPEDIDYNNGMILLANAYLEKDSLEKAKKVSESINSLDAYFCTVMGKIEYASKNEIKALEIFQLALTRASKIRPAKVVRSESLYYAALIYDNWYRANPSPENRRFALISWEKLQSVHSPGEQRYNLALQKIAGYEEK
jgi:serine/threonine protein kinase